MHRVVVISLVIIAALTFAGFKARAAGYQSIATALFTAVIGFLFFLFLGFSGVIGN